MRTFDCRVQQKQVKLLQLLGRAPDQSADMADILRRVVGLFATQDEGGFVLGVILEWDGLALRP
jgi:hypothetical protein